MNTPQTPPMLILCGRWRLHCLGQRLLWRFPGSVETYVDSARGVVKELLDVRLFPTNRMSCDRSGSRSEKGSR